MNTQGYKQSITISTMQFSLSRRIASWSLWSKGLLLLISTIAFGSVSTFAFVALADDVATPQAVTDAAKPAETVSQTVAASQAKAAPQQDNTPKKDDSSQASVESDDVSVFPLIEVKQDNPVTDKFGILISGDGGWWSLDKMVAEVLASHGAPVVGISSYKYFPAHHTPDTTAADMTRILRHYMREWKKEKIILIGYSLGAEIIPFVATRLPEDLRSKVIAIVMIAPSKETEFEFHATDWVHTPSDRSTYPVQPEIEKLYGGAKLICTTSDGDSDCICGKLDATKVKVISRPGGHHYGGDFKGIADAIWDELKDLK
jgi:type IV secretory pathway VirJ component